MKQKQILTAIIASVLISSLITVAIVWKSQQKTEEDYIKEFYTVENAVHVSPHSIRKAMAKGEMNFVLVDLRSKEEYEEEHIIGAVNIPAYKDKDTSDYGAVDRIVGSFKELKEKNLDKDIIVYCYSMPCMTGRKVGKILADHDIYVKHLGIGWNEWRYFWNQWNHQHEWNQTDVKDYVWTGSDPGVPRQKDIKDKCSASAELGC
ncbi:MAG: rhodanese-like domain-containing protein [Candidatus Woesearchaeota archaeon]